MQSLFPSYHTFKVILFFKICLRRRSNKSKQRHDEHKSRSDGVKTQDRKRSSRSSRRSRDKSRSRSAESSSRERRSPSIRRRRGSPSHLDRRRITRYLHVFLVLTCEKNNLSDYPVIMKSKICVHSARKRPIPYHRQSMSPSTDSDQWERSRTPPSARVRHHHKVKGR